MSNKDLVAILGLTSVLLFVLLSLSKEKNPSIDRLRKAYSGLEVEE